MGDFPRSVKEHYNKVAGLGCVITSGPASIHHCHGGTMRERLVSYGLNGTKGMSKRGYSDALVLPLSPHLHYLDGGQAIDGSMGVRAWEARYGHQADFLDGVSELLGYDLWALHAEWTRQREKFRKPTGNS